MSAGRKSRRLDHRLNRAITGGEIALLAAGLAAGCCAWLIGDLPYSLWLKEVPEVWGFLVYLATGVAAPAFVGVLLAMAFPSWRYKSVGGVLLLFVIMAMTIRQAVILSGNGFWGFAGGVIRFATAAAAALTALFLWRRLGEVRAGRPGTTPAPAMTPAVRRPRTSLFLLVLSLVSIPAAYLSIVLSAFVTIGLCAVLLVVLSELEMVPVVLLVAAGLAPILGAIVSFMAVRVLLRRAVQPAQGIRLDMAAHPVMAGVLSEMCARIGTRPPDHVMLLAAPNCWVTQGTVQGLDGSIAGRTLALGLPLVKALGPAECCSIIAHELAHFSGRDTLYSVLTAPVYRGLEAALAMLAGGGQPSRSWLQSMVRILQVPAMQFLVCLYGYFASIAMGVSRCRESRADWIAAEEFGSDAHARAITTAAAMLPHFDKAILRLGWQDDATFFTAYEGLFAAESLERQRHVEDAMADPESEFSSHPSLRARTEGLPAFPPRQVAPADFRGELAADEARLARAFAPLVARAQKEARAGGAEGAGGAEARDGPAGDTGSESGPG